MVYAYGARTAHIGRPPGPDGRHGGTGAAERVKERLQFDYTTVGHVTVDVLADGSMRPGGSAFYSALQAARLGRRTLILTQGVPREIEGLLEPFAGELELRVLPARHTTTLETSGSGPARRQRVLAWAGAIEQEIRLDTALLHLAPVARELPRHWHAPGAFVGLTPQGLIRTWPRAGGEVSLVAPSRSDEKLVGRCEALVLSEYERASATPLIERALDGYATVVLTAESRPSTILLPRDGGSLEVEVPPIAGSHEDLGAGDVFAAAFFVELSGGSPPERAVAFATAAAAVRIQGAGAAAIGAAQAIGARLDTVAGQRL